MQGFSRNIRWLKKLRFGCFTHLWMHLLSQFWCPFIISIIIYFSYDSPVKHGRDFFAEMIRGFQLLTVLERKFHLRCLTNFECISQFNFWCCFIMSIVVHFSFIFDAILSFPCFIIITRFNYLKWTFVCYHLNIFCDVIWLYCLLWTFFSIFN